MSNLDAAVPDALLVPLLESAAETLRAMDSPDVPLSLRHLHGFDRRGLLSGPGARQLRQGFSRDLDFRARVLERFSARSEVKSTLKRWAKGDAFEVVEEATRSQDLALLVSVLFACEPPDFSFGLGIALTLEAGRRRERGDKDAVRAQDKEVAALEEARRRADVARIEAEAEAARVTEALREERSSRRTREEQAERATNAARTRADELSTELEAAREEITTERTRASREAQRARALEADVRRLKAELVAAGERIAELTPRPEPTPPPEPAGWVAATAPPSEPARRVRPDLPPGMIQSTPPAIEAMLRTDGVVLVIDGYNVTKRAWPDASPADQRERLGMAVTALNRRLGCPVTCVFDGDGSGHHQVIRRGGVRVMFSDAGVEADEVVVREVAQRSKRIPVVVASSDSWVREHAEAEGAVVIPADALLAVIRTTG